MKKKLLLISLLLLLTLTFLFSEEQHCGKHFPKSVKEKTATESICGIVQVAENQLQLVQDSTKVTFNLIIPENLEKEMENILIGKKYIFTGKKSKNTFIVDNFSIFETSQTGGNHRVDSNKCIGCSLCVNQCPEGAISIVNGKAVINAEKCNDCGICVTGNGHFNGCPVKAIEKSN